MTIEEWAKDFKSYVNELQMPRDDYKGIMEYIDDAIALLKEQEAKLLTFEEVEKHYSIPRDLLRNIWEYVDYANDIEPLYLECPDDDGFVLHWRTYDSISMRLDGWKKDYGKTWRCWTKKPTLVQRQAVKWE